MTNPRVGIHRRMRRRPAGGNGFARFTRRLGLIGTNQYFNVVDASGSRGLVAFDRHTGRKLWEVEALHSFLHNGIAAAGGRVYCLDRLPKSMTDKLRRRAASLRPTIASPPSICGTGPCCGKPGQRVWHVAGLLQAARYPAPGRARATDRLRDEAKEGMIAYRAATGEVLWQKLDLRYTGPASCTTIRF